MILKADNVSLRYCGNAAPALESVALTVAAGDLVVLAGPNGSGKSTLLRVLGGLLVPDKGSVTLDTRAVGSWPRRAWAQLVGVLSQREEPAFPMSVVQSVMLGRWARLGAIAPPGKADHAAVEQAMSQCGVDHLAARSIDTLSGGEWQRVRVARALATEPKFLLLDEPSGALDLRHEMALYELLHELTVKGIGVLAITHHLNVASRYAQRLVVLSQGRIAAQGSVGDVLTADLVSSVYQWPVVVDPWRGISPQVIPLRKNEVES
jgi:iron complex transport system ATP-binding protein